MEQAATEVTLQHVAETGKNFRSPKTYRHLDQIVKCRTSDAIGDRPNGL